jgi:hypothetical protein
VSKPHVAIDLDKTWSAAPDLFNFLGKAIRAAGGKVTILSGNPDAKSDIKKLGIKGKAYDEAVTVTGASDGPDQDDFGAAKEAWLAENDGDFLIDNSAENCIAATRVCSAALFFAQQVGETRAMKVDLDRLARRRSK